MYSKLGHVEGLKCNVCCNAIIVTFIYLASSNDKQIEYRIKDRLGLPPLISKLESSRMSPTSDVCVIPSM